MDRLDARPTDDPEAIGRAFVAWWKTAHAAETDPAPNVVEEAGTAAA